MLPLFACDLYVCDKHPIPAVGPIFGHNSWASNDTAKQQQEQQTSNSGPGIASICMSMAAGPAFGCAQFIGQHCGQFEDVFLGAHSRACFGHQDTAVCTVLSSRALTDDFAACVCVCVW